METSTPTPSAGSGGTADGGTGAVSLTWSTPALHDQERSPRWYAVGGGIVAVIAVAGIVSAAWTMVLVTLLIAAMYVLLRRSPPVIRSVALSERGVTVGTAFTAWADCAGYWIIRTPAWSELHVRRRSRLQPDLRVRTGDIDPAEIRAFLSQYLAEQSDRSERWMDAIIRICKL